MITRRVSVVVAALTLAAVKGVLVLPALCPNSLYRDDAWQALAVRVQSPRDVLVCGVTAPGFAVLLRQISAAADVREAWLQTPAILAGVAGPILVFLVAIRWGISETTSFLAAMLLCVASTHTEYSTRVKPYTLDTCATAVALALAKQAVDDREDHVATGLLALFSACAFVCSATAGLAPFAFILTIAAMRIVNPPRRWRSQWAAIILYVLAVSGWYLFVLRLNTTSALNEFWHDRFVNWNVGPASAMKSIAFNGARVFTQLTPFQSTLPRALGGVALIVAAAVGLSVVVREDGKRAWLLAAPLAFALILFLIGKYPLGGGRTDLYLAPVPVLLAACGWERIAKSLRVSWAIMLLACVLPVVSFVWARADYPVEDMRALTRTIESRASSSDVIIVLPETTYMYALYSRANIGLERDPLAMTGFTPTSDDSRVVMMPGFEYFPNSEVSRRGVARCLELLDAATKRTPQRIWLVQSRYFAEHIPLLLEESMENHGWSACETVAYDNVVATGWERKGESEGSTKNDLDEGNAPR